jgi:hypothetical protein
MPTEAAQDQAGGVLDDAAAGRLAAKAEQAWLLVLKSMALRYGKISVGVSPDARPSGDR